jgi:hypothetical protein
MQPPDAYLGLVDLVGVEKLSRYRLMEDVSYADRQLNAGCISQRAEFAVVCPAVET